MRYSIAIPQLATAPFDAAATRDFLQRAEQLGFEAGWTGEQTVGVAPYIAPLELLSWAASCTTTLRLGVAALVTSLHDPLQLASTVTGVDRLSHGRLDLGVAAGGAFRPFAAFGVDRATFISSFTEGLRLMKAAWADEETLTFHGRFRTVDGVTVTPKPVQRPHPPIWFGGHAPAALARAVRHGDAYMGAGSSTTEQFAKAVPRLRGELDAQDRDAATFTIGKRVYLVVDDDPARARDLAAAGLARIYGDAVPHIDRVAVTGPPDRVADGLREVIDAGAETILLNPMGADVAADREQMERLAAEVLPRLI